MSQIYTKLAKIQKELKAPKGQWNDFSKFNYRSCEDILEAVKPLLDGLTIIIEDEMVNIGERYYVKATVTISDGEASIKASAFARESLDKKGMDDAQITGATSSYARKYALNGLFAIDDTKDADTMDNTKTTRTSQPAKNGAPSRPVTSTGLVKAGFDKCPECHAPTGKPHSTKCSLGKGEMAKRTTMLTEPI